MGERDGRRRPAAPDQLRTLPRAKGDGKRFTNKLYADSARSPVADSPDTSQEEHGKVVRGSS